MPYQCATCGKSYAQATADYFCTDCGYDGLLVDDAVGATLGKQGPDPEIGLCVLLMDASGSMKNPAFPGSPISKMRLVANSAANGIFDLRQMGLAANAYICAMLFDDCACVGGASAPSKCLMAALLLKKIGPRPTCKRSSDSNCTWLDAFGLTHHNLFKIPALWQRK